MMLLITGFPCSGKSLLRNVCSLHPAIEVTEEFGSFKKLDVPYMEHVAALRRSWFRDPVVGSADGSLFRWRWRNGLFMARYLIELRARCHGLVSAQDVEGVLRDIFPHAAVVGDALGRYRSVLSKLTGVPGLLAVVVHRDCRDLITGHLLRRGLRKRREALLRWSATRECVADLLRGGHKKRRAVSVVERASAITRIAKGWVRAVEKTEPYADRGHVIRYEDVVTNPQATLAVLSDRLGVDPQGFQYQMLDPSLVGAYKQNLSEEEVSKIIEIAGPTMKRLGYL